MKSAAEFMSGINIWQDFYFLTPGLSTSGGQMIQTEQRQTPAVSQREKTVLDTQTHRDPRPAAETPTTSIQYMREYNQ